MKTEKKWVNKSPPYLQIVPSHHRYSKRKNGESCEWNQSKTLKNTFMKIFTSNAPKKASTNIRDFSKKDSKGRWEELRLYHLKHPPRSA